MNLAFRIFEQLIFFLFILHHIYGEQWLPSIYGAITTATYMCVRALYLVYFSGLWSVFSLVTIFSTKKIPNWKSLPSLPKSAIFMIFMICPQIIKILIQFFLLTFFLKNSLDLDESFVPNISKDILSRLLFYYVSFGDTTIDTE